MNKNISEIINAAIEKELPDLVFKNAKIIDVFSLEVIDGDIAVLDLEPGEGADRLEGHEDIDRDDGAKGGQRDQQHMPAGQFTGHHSLLP